METFVHRVLGSRAVERPVSAGRMTECVHCNLDVKFQAKQRLKQIICNVYEGDRWDRVEYYHPTCYDFLGHPYGEPDRSRADDMPQ